MTSIIKRLVEQMLKCRFSYVQEQQHAESDRHAVAAAWAQAERERLSQEYLEQQQSHRTTWLNFGWLCIVKLSGPSTFQIAASRFSQNAHFDVQGRQRAEDDRRAVTAAREEAERERLSRKRLEQQVTGHHSRVSHLCFVLP